MLHLSTYFKQMNGKKPYHPNNWKLFKEAPDEAFHPHTFEEVMDFKVAGWELPADVACMIRATNLKNYKTKEYIYKRQHAAERRIRKLMQAQTHEFIICTHDAVHYVGPDYLDD